MRPLFLSLLFLASFEAHAAERAFRFEVGGGAHWVMDSSFDVVSENDVLGQFTLAGGWSPGWVDNRLSLRLGYTGGGAESMLFQRWKSSLSLATLDLSARYDFLRNGRVRAFARGGVLFDFARWQVHSNDASVDDSAFGAGALAALGGELSLSAPDSDSRVHVSLLAEVLWAQRFSGGNFQLTQNIEDDGDSTPIASAPVSSGAIDLSGPSLSFALLLRF